MKTNEAKDIRGLFEKKRVASIYETDTFKSFFDEILHPGGLKLTQKVAEIAEIQSGCKILDIASGNGLGGLFIAQTYDCNIVGIDISRQKVLSAQGYAKSRKLTGKSDFILSDAEDLPFRDQCFDAVISECSFSILPNKRRGAEEIYRVLKPQGKVVVTDIIVKKDESKSAGKDVCEYPEIALLPCLKGAACEGEYVEIFENVGFNQPYIEDHTVALKKVGYRMALTFGDWNHFFCELAKELSSKIAEPEDNHVESRPVEQYGKMLSRIRLGYGLISMTRPLERRHPA